MIYFFENIKTNEERWDFIEEYFLGVNLIDKYKIEVRFPKLAKLIQLRRTFSSKNII